MGYILPVGNDQYKDYQKRTTETKQNRFFVEKPSKVMMETKHHQLNQEQLNKSGYHPAQPKMTRGTDNTYAKLTGTGTKFNETI